MPHMIRAIREISRGCVSKMGEIGSETQSSQNSGRATINDKRMYQWSINGHLSSGRCKPTARAVMIAFGAGEAPERRANLPSPQMTIDN